MQATGTNIIINIGHRALEYPVNGKTKLFKQGCVYATTGNVSLVRGCGSCGTRKNIVHYLVVEDGVTYAISSQYASQNVPTGPIAGPVARVNDLGDGHTVITGDSTETTLNAEARNKAFKIIL